MSTEYDDLIIEKAARALHREKCSKPCSNADELDRDDVRVVLSAAGPALEARGARKVVEAVDLMSHLDSCVFPDSDCTCRVIAFRIAVRAALAAIEGGAAE